MCCDRLLVTCPVWTVTCCPCTRRRSWRCMISCMTCPLVETLRWRGELSTRGITLPQYMAACHSHGDTGTRPAAGKTGRQQSAAYPGLHGIFRLCKRSTQCMSKDNALVCMCVCVNVCICTGCVLRQRALWWAVAAPAVTWVAAPRSSWSRVWTQATSRAVP